MDKAYMKSVFEIAISKYGESKQLVKVIEELSELQQAICRIFCDRADKENIVEEIADVEIMLEQMKMILNIPEDLIEEVKIGKVERLEKRIMGITIYDRVSEYENKQQEDETYGCEGSI